MATISNQATLNYKSGNTDLSTASNTATVTLQGPLDVRKHALESSYQLGDVITYNIFIQNTGSTILTNLTVTDNLGTFAFSPTLNLTPLTYIPSGKIFLDNVFSREITGTVSEAQNSVVFDLGTLNPTVTVLLQYKAKVNEFAGVVVGTSVIENTASVTADGINSPVTAKYSLAVASYASLEIEKTMTPDPVIDGSPLTYTFILKNYGTLSATDVVLRDVFSPAPDVTTVTVNGASTTDFSYTTGVFRYPALNSADTYTVDAATFKVDQTTGVVTIVPGTSTVTIRGTI